MISLKKYERPEIEVVLIENDIITSSGGLGGGDIMDPWDNVRNLDPASRPLGIFKRN